MISTPGITMAKSYRQGATGALLDEYERAIADLKTVIDVIPDSALSITVDAKTEDENCRSVQTILTHVTSAGYGYATSIHNLKCPGRTRPDKVYYTTIREYQEDLANVFSFTEYVLKAIKDDELEQLDNSLKIKAGWGQLYDAEQMMEHAIVHILRHRRQIEQIIQRRFRAL